MEPVSHAYLVFHRKGKPVKDIRYQWKKACQRMGILPTGEKHFRLHDERHNFYRDSRRGGVARREVMDAMGHKTMSTADRYDSVTDEDVKEAFQKLEATRKSHEKSHKAGK